MTWIARQWAPAFILAIGVVVALAAYFATSMRAPDAAPDLDVVRLPIYVLSWKASHFDPLTGEPRGLSYTANNHGLGPIVRVEPVPADMVGRRAIPLPLGFGLGALAGLALIVTARRRATPRPTMTA